jgi:hypothetical protein
MRSFLTNILRGKGAETVKIIGCLFLIACFSLSSGAKTKKQIIEAEKGKLISGATVKPTLSLREVRL